jgi:predicted transposase YbfD/YdcC
MSARSAPTSNRSPTPRHTRNRKHLLVDIAVIAVCGVVCGCDGPTAIHRWAKHRAPWLAQHLALPHGIPSRDCIRRLLVALKPEAFQRCFQAWIADAIRDRRRALGRLVAIDGKTCRRSHDRPRDLGALHIVSAWATEEGIALGQVATDAKSNEITAIPQLLEQIEPGRHAHTIDAMGCQKVIVEQVVTGRRLRHRRQGQPAEAPGRDPGHFLDHLERDLEGACGTGITRRVTRGTVASTSGRTVSRRSPRASRPAMDWPWVKAIGYACGSPRMPTARSRTRCGIISAAAISAGKRFGEAVRGHWGIESMHWVLDVNFREDESRTRERTLGNNLSWLRRFAVTLLKRHPAKDSSG